jgi:hypothetical protein
VPVDVLAAVGFVMGIAVAVGCGESAATVCVACPQPPSTSARQVAPRRSQASGRRRSELEYIAYLPGGIDDDRRVLISSWAPSLTLTGGMQRNTGSA